MNSRERGSATITAIGLLGVLLFVGAALAAVGGVFVSHRTAEAAADLAALAGAGALADGSPCPVASAVAAENGATLVDCRTEGREVWVAVRVGGPRWLGHGADPVAEARAGPAS